MKTIAGNCKITGKFYSVVVDAIQYDGWRNGDRCIQDALPNMSVGDREFLISGISPEGWIEMYGKEEEDA